MLCLCDYECAHKPTVSKPEHYKLCKCGIFYYDSAKEICAVCGKSVTYIIIRIHKIRYPLPNETENTYTRPETFSISKKYGISRSRIFHKFQDGQKERERVGKSQRAHSESIKIMCGKGWGDIINGQLNGMSPVTYEVRFFRFRCEVLHLFSSKEEIAINISEYCYCATVSP